MIEKEDNLAGCQQPAFALRTYLLDLLLLAIASGHK